MTQRDSPDPATVLAGGRPAPAPPDDPAALAAALDDPRAAPPSSIGRSQRRRFDVHRNNCAHALIEALRASFPAVARLVGERFFTALARAFSEQERPASPLLFEYGAGFPAFVEAFPPAARLPYLAEVARLEWLRLRAYHAADRDPAALGDLAALGPGALPGARLVPHPALGVLAARWPALSIRAATMSGEGHAQVDMSQGEEIAVVRPGLEVAAHPLPAGGAAFLAALIRGEPLGAAAGSAVEDEPRFDLPATLERIFAIGAVAGVQPGALGAPSGDR